MMKNNENVQEGQYIRITGDSFTQDPHCLEIGSIHRVESVTPAVKFDELPPMIQLILAMDGGNGVDIPSRVHVKTGRGIEDYGNVPFSDFEIVTEAQPAPKPEGTFKVRMIEDDLFDGYSAGDVFEVEYEEESDGYVFTDHDGDVRFIEDHEHERI